MPKIEVVENKTLKLGNVLGRKMNIEEFKKIPPEKIITLLRTHLLSKGAPPRGPLISHNTMQEGNNFISFMMQANKAVKAENPYYFMEEIIINNCLFTRFKGKEHDVDFAFQKMNIYAYENDILLKTESYSVYLNEKQERNEVIVDIFMPVKK